MLVLGRREGQQIIINEDLIMKVCYIDTDKKFVKFGFEASKRDYIIDRFEIFQRKVEERG